MEQELTIPPKRSVSDSAGGQVGKTPTAVTHQACFPRAVREHRDHQHPAHPAVFVRCSFAPVRPCVHLVCHPSDLRAVMTSETVLAEQPGALVDECRISRDRTVATGYA